MKPPLILFDAGGTLVLQAPDIMGNRLGLDIPADVAFEAHYRTMAEFSRLRTAGESVTWDWWLERYFERLGHPAPETAGGLIDRGYKLWSWAIPGAIEALERLLDSGIRLAVVSNSDGSVAESLSVAGFDGILEDVVDSHLVGCAKPDPRIFHVACGRLGVDPSDVWYVGDSMFHDIGGATAAGLAGAWLVDPLGLYPEHSHRVTSVAALPELIAS